MRLISNEELLIVAGGFGDEDGGDWEDTDEDSFDSPDGSGKKKPGGGGGSSDTVCTDKIITVTSERTIKTVEFGWSGVKIEYQGGESKTETITECTGPKPKDGNDKKKTTPE
nr:hypothetical protein [uncultured Undibacterium sp.]